MKFGMMNLIPISADWTRKRINTHFCPSVSSFSSASRRS